MDEHLLDYDLEALYTEIMAATRPEDVFGRPAKNLPLPEQQAAQERRFRELTAALDPNRYTRIVDATAASDARLRLTEWYETAKAALVSGTSLFTFMVGQTTYHIGERIAVGDYSVLHRGTATLYETTSEVVLKIAKDESTSRVLTTEAEQLRAFHVPRKYHPVQQVLRTLPKLYGSFKVEGRTVNVLPYYHSHRSVRDIQERLGGTLPVGHAAWIGRRLLAFPLTAALAGLTHHAMTLEHLLVHPLTHEPIYLGWGETERRGREPGNLENLVLSETFAQIRQLFGNGRGGYNPDTPRPLTEYLDSAAAHHHGVDAGAVFHEFTELIYATLGKQYRPLNLT